MLSLSRLALANTTNADAGYEFFIGSSSDCTNAKEIFPPAPIKIVGALPEWLKGSYFVAGPHMQKIGSTRVQHFLDGLGKMYRFDMEPTSQTAAWSSAWIKSALYNRSAEMGKEAPTVQFQETTPPRGYSGVRNALFGVNDNDYVANFPAADGSSMLGTTDDTFVTRYSTDLQRFSRFAWSDDLVPRLHQAQAVAHPVLNATSGVMTGLLIVSPELPIGSPYAQLYRTLPADPTRRVALGGQIGLANAGVYMHSFGLSDSHAVVCEHAWKVDSELLIKGEMFEGATAIEPHTKTLLHVIDLATGKVTTHSSTAAFLCVHFTNLHNNGSALVFDMPTWQTVPGSDAPCQPYEVFDFARVDNKSQRDAFSERCANTLVRHAIPLAAAPSAPPANASFEVLDGGWFEYPFFNLDWRGRRSCFIYLTEWFADGATFGAMAIVKFDTCRRERAATFYQPALYPSEPHFVGRPGATAEDDGVVITTMMDGADGGHAAHVAVLDARSMSTVATLPLGEHVPSTVHGWFRFSS
mmetsp:Transcript_48102/g.126574  ORF Transcript_48102/g.126574 Transcript_48102/m.126574 type:complete len:525 (-) Transcript_48102:107-1681(-)